MDNSESPAIGTPPPPPPPSPPPVIQPPPPARARSGGGGWKILALVLLVVVVLGSGLVALGLFSSLAHFQPPYAQAVGPRLEEILVEDNDAAVKIAVVEVEG